MNGVYCDYVIFAALTNIDAILVIYYLPTDITGNYSAITVLGKIALIDPRGIVFVGIDGSNVYNIVRRYLELASIDKSKRGPHILRHTFCTRLHQKGVSPFTIKELTGHKSLNTTMRYIKIENKEQTEAIDRLEFRIF